MASAVCIYTFSTGAEGRRRTPSALRIFDSRLPLSRTWLGSDIGNSIDVAREKATRWSQLRNSVPAGSVAGLTRWSDYIQARGALEQKGKRLRLEARSGELFYWEMI